jgi:hypothetical protein
MDLQPFPVRAKNPHFVIIEFFDNNFSEEADRALDAMAGAAGTDLAVLAVTDQLTTPAQVTEVTAGSRTTLEALGRIDTGDPLLLAKLLTRALISYPNAGHVAIGFAGHGSGVFDDHDAHPNPLVRLLRLLHSAPAPRALPAHESLAFYSLLLDRSGGVLTNKELRAMLRYGFEDAGRTGKPVDLIFFDTCLNGMIEVVTEIAEFADCIVGSNGLQPGAGWNYAEWLNRMRSSTPGNGIAWGRQAVEAMEAGYAGQAPGPVTLSAVRPGYRVMQCFADLVREADRSGQAGFSLLDRARLQSHAYGDRLVDSRDLGGFAARLAEQREVEQIATAAVALRLAVDEAVMDSVPRDPEFSGLAFWFPERRSAFERDVDSYSQLTFDEETRWSSYLYQYLPH